MVFGRALDAQISIHAPSRGRLYRPDCMNTPEHFNPRPLAGATPLGRGLFGLI